MAAGSVVGPLSVFLKKLKKKQGQIEFIHISAWNPNDPLVPIESPNDRTPLPLNCSIVSHFLPTPHQSGRNQSEAERKSLDAAISRAVGTQFSFREKNLDTISGYFKCGTPT